MSYSIHTFEISLTLPTPNFIEQLKKAYKKAKKSHKLYEENGSIYKDYALKSKGIKTEYHKGQYKKKIKFIINPSRLLDGDDLRLWKPDKDNIAKMIKKLKSVTKDYFDSKYKLNDFQLTRVDFTVNIDVVSRKNVSAYIKILHKLGKVKGFAPKYDKYDKRIDKDLSFDLEGNSNGIEFTAYDKEGESKRKEAKGILRVEVKLTKQKSLRKYSNETNTAKRIKDLARNSKKIFMETFKQVVPDGGYYEMKEATKIIENSSFKKKQKEKMIKLLELIYKKKSLLMAQKDLNDRNIDKIMDSFAELKLSPITISKRHEVKQLENLYDYL